MSIFKWFDPFANKNYDLMGMTQVLSENKLGYKWEKQEASQMPSMRIQENALSDKMSEDVQAGILEEVNNIRNQMQVCSFEIIVFQRKDEVKSSQLQ